MANSFFVYILKSEKTDKFYIGYSENPEQRLAEHNSGKCISTRNGIPWKKVYQESFETSQEALKREKQIKKMKSRTYILGLIKKDETQTVELADKPRLTSG